LATFLGRVPREFLEGAAVSELGHHFTEVASRYRELRTLDPEPVMCIRDGLPRRPSLGVDIACGTGRYTEQLYEELPQGSLILAVDLNWQMLRILKSHRQAGDRFWPIEARAEVLPLPPASMDWATTFNAVHHLELARFLHAATTILKPGGKLFIYTRTPEQNARTVWGRFFPGFTEK
jgi:ubiquinone/menaquinone biosynthesis C-methylase UbiE